MLLALYLLFCLVTVPLLLLRDRLAGTVYGMLFLYSIFALFGYLYMPGLSEGILAYFGDDVGHDATLFIFGSMALIFIANMWIYSSGSTNELKVGFKTNFVTKGNFPLPCIAVPYFLAGLLGFLAFNNAERLSWEAAQQVDQPIEFTIMLGLFKISVGILAAIYVMIREKIRLNYRQLIIPFISYLLVFFAISILLGNRTDPAALALGILFYESLKNKIDFKMILRTFAIIFVAVVSLSVVEFIRYENNYSVSTLTERIVRNDYFAPAHMLFAAIAFDFVDASEAWRSISNNALILQNYPYLQEKVTDLFNPGVATRSAGYAFYVLSEGYIMLGFLGVFYNAAVISLFVRIWAMAACTDSRVINVMIQTVLATMCINVVRSQSSQFIKVLYTYFIPVMIVLVIMLGLAMTLRRRAVRQDFVVN